MSYVGGVDCVRTHCSDYTSTILQNCCSCGDLLVPVTQLIDRNPPLLAGLLREQGWAGRLVGALAIWDGAGEPTGARLKVNWRGMTGQLEGYMQKWH